MSADTSLMPIPGPVDPVPVKRAAAVRADGRTNWSQWKRLYSCRARGGGARAQAGQIRAKQIWHWIYHRGVGDLPHERYRQAQRLWLAEHFVITARGGRGASVDRWDAKLLLRTHDGHDYEMVFIPDA